MNPPPGPAEVGRIWFEEMWNRRDAALAREYMAPGAIGYLEGGRTITGPEDFLMFQQSFLRAIPDIALEVLNLVAQGEDVCVHWKADGTHTGSGLGFPATGAKVSFQGTTWLKVREGKIREGRDFWDMTGLMKTLSSAKMA